MSGMGKGRKLGKLGVTIYKEATRKKKPKPKKSLTENLFGKTVCMTWDYYKKK